jgi:hypothetical protein
MGHGIKAIPKRFDLVTLRIFGAATIAMRQVFWVIVLKSFHRFSEVDKVRSVASNQHIH